MIDITAINTELVSQDSALRERFAEIAARVSNDASALAFIGLLSEGLAAIHERQGNLIILMLQTAV